MYRLCVWPRNTKEPPPFGSGSSTNWTYISPSYAVEGTSWGSVLDPTEGLRVQLLGHGAPARRQKAFEAF